MLLHQSSVEELTDLISEKVLSKIESLLDRKSMNPILDKEYISIKEVCSLFGVTRQTVHHWVKQGKLEKITLSPRSIRFNTVHVLELLKKSERKRN